jgi:MFS transporter, UMF1 family
MQTAPKKVVNAWAMYDWANSVYSLVITTTFFPIYFDAVTSSAYGEDTVPFLGMTFKNSALYLYSLSAAYLIIVFLLPILSSIADSRGNKKSFMKFFCYLGGLACSGLFFFTVNEPNLWIGLGCSMLAVIGFVGSVVFYNSYLPEIAAPADMDRISAKGFSLGYVGSVILQIIGFALVLYFTSKGDNFSGPRYTFLLVGAWWIGFAQITFAYLPNGKPSATVKNKDVIQAGFNELGKVWSQVKRLAVLKRFLFSFFFYAMGVQTIFLAASFFGSKVLNLQEANLIVTLVIVQLIAIIGATQMAKLSGKFGNFQVLIGAVIIWIIICIAAFLMANKAESGYNTEYLFYGLAAAVGLVMGGIQSISRSTYSKLMPDTKDTASYFSFYDVTEKTAIVIGMFTFGFVDELSSMKYSVLFLIIFFTIGLFGLISTLKKSRQKNVPHME